MNARAIIERALAEALPNELAYLAKSLQLTDEEKAVDAAYHYAYSLKRYAAGNEIALETDVDDDPHGAVEELQTKHPEQFKEFADWVLTRVMPQAEDHELPWATLNFRGYVRDEWLLHFSDDAHRVWDSGFKYGVDPDDTRRIALTTNYAEKTRKKGPGFNFAFLAKDVKRYAYDRHGRGTKYGKEAVMFRASGIKVWHSGDDEPQVIFMGQNAHDPVYLYRGGEGWAVGERPEGEPIFQAEDLDEVIDWVSANYSQYRKTLRPARERPAPPTKRRAATAPQPAGAPASTSAGTYGSKAVADEADRLVPAAR